MNYYKEENQIEESARVPEYFVKRRPDIQKCLLESINKHFVVSQISIQILKSHNY